MVLHLGSGNSERPKALTLKQFILENEGHVPNQSHVTFIFLPDKIPNYSLLTDHNFRVNIHKDSSLYKLFNEHLAQWFEQSITLLVCPNVENPGEFSLAIEESRISDWEAKPWGYSIGASRKPPRRATKSPVS